MYLSFATFRKHTVYQLSYARRIGGDIIHHMEIWNGRQAKRRQAPVTQISRPSARNAWMHSAVVANVRTESIQGLHRSEGFRHWEADGASEEILQAADRRVRLCSCYGLISHHLTLFYYPRYPLFIQVYLPLHGFSESLNLSVASALCLYRLFNICPSTRGNMSEEEKNSLRASWYTRHPKF